MAKATAQYPTVRLKPPSDFRYDKRLEGWELLEDVAIVGDEMLEFAPVLEEGDGEWVQGPVLLEREKKIDRRAGQRHLELLQGQVADIPPKLDDKYLLGLGTVWRHRGDLIVPYLSRRDGGRRRLGFYNLGHSFNRGGVSVRLCK